MIFSGTNKQSHNFTKAVPYLLSYKTGFSLSRMTTNIPIKFCSSTCFTLPKQDLDPS